MEIEQIEKRLEWLDEERRKDKNAISALEDKMTRMEGGIQTVNKEIKGIKSELSQFNTILGRLDQLDGVISEVRIEIGKMTESLHKSRLDIEYDQEAKRRAEYDGLNKSIIEVRKSAEQITDLKKQIKQVSEEQKRYTDAFNSMDTKVMQSKVAYEEFQRSQKSIEDTHKIDSKRVIDLQGEVSAYRKRIDEQRSRVDLMIENLKKVEARLTEVIQSEAERKQNQLTFIERQNQAQVERDRSWRDMSAKFGVIEQASTSLESSMHELDESLRAIRRTKDQLDDATQRIDRRVNEITEMHRLNEDHFRQEWMAFKADEQKSWANYNLVQDEQGREFLKQMDKMEERLIQLEDLTQKLNDGVNEMSEETRNRLRGLLEVTHAWITSHERVFGNPPDNS